MNTEYQGVGIAVSTAPGSMEPNITLAIRHPMQTVMPHKPIAKITPVVPEKNFANVSNVYLPTQ